MVKAEYIKELYSHFTEHGTITTQELYECGFNTSDIIELIEKKIIEREREGYYRVIFVRGLYSYGRELKETNFNKAMMCFERCLEIDPNCQSAAFNLFIHSINERNYKRAVELCDILLKTDNKYFKQDTNYYIYLLNDATDLPKKYKEYAKSLTIEDIKVLVGDKRYKNIALENDIRSLVLKKKYSLANIVFRKLIREQGKTTGQQVIPLILLLRVEKAENASQNTLINLLKEKNYQGALDYLQEKKDSQRLNRVEETCLGLIKTYINICDTGIIPLTYTTNTTSVFTAIINNDFKLALRNNRIYDINNNISVDGNPISIILKDICDLIDEILHGNNLGCAINQKQEVLTPSKNESVDLTKILTSLLENNFDMAYKYLNSYLRQIKKTKYEFLIVNLIKLSILKGRTYFTEPMTTLSLIENDVYKFDISEYIQKFYITLSQNEFQEARIYLDIISNANKIGFENSSSDKLYQLLTSAEKILDQKKDMPKIEQEEQYQKKQN